MGKLDDFINNYVQKADILLEQEPLPAPPVPGPEAIPGGDPMAAAAAPMDTPPEQPTEPESLTTPGYASLVQDAIMLLRIGMMKGEDWRMDDDRVNDLFDEDTDDGSESGKQNVTDLHETIRDLIRDYKDEIE